MDHSLPAYGDSVRQRNEPSHTRTKYALQLRMPPKGIMLKRAAQSAGGVCRRVIPEMCLAGCSQHPAVCFFWCVRPMSKRFERSHLSPQAPFQYSLDFRLPNSLLVLESSQRVLCLPLAFVIITLDCGSVLVLRRLTVLLHARYAWGVFELQAA